WKAALLPDDAGDHAEWHSPRTVAAIEKGLLHYEYLFQDRRQFHVQTAARIAMPQVRCTIPAISIRLREEQSYSPSFLAPASRAARIETSISRHCACH